MHSFGKALLGVLLLTLGVSFLAQGIAPPESSVERMIGGALLGGFSVLVFESID